MTRWAARVALFGALVLSADGLSAGYFDGSVGIMERPSGPFYSAGVAEYYNDSGSRNFDITVSGEHAINDVSSGVSIAFRSYSRSTGDYNYFVEGTATAGSCYRARLTATAYPFGLLFSPVHQEWGTEQLCKSAAAPDPPPPPPEYQPPGDCNCSPIIIDLDFNGFHLTGTDDPVWFDINADGRPKLMSWTAAGERDAFLVLDRNGNGMIDNGRELFGNHTPLSTGATTDNGYLPLFEFDKPGLGGNGNGFIDEGDAVFSRLRVWIDWNHNGLSEPGELLTLPEAGIVRFACEYSRIGRRDRHGNLFRYKGKAWIVDRAGGEREINTYDVFFRLAN